MNLVPRDGTLVGFRPEHLLPADHVPGERVTLSFEVDRVEYLSGDRHVYGDGDRSRRGHPGDRPAAGDDVRRRCPRATHEFAVDADRVRFFDEESGLRNRTRKPVGADRVAEADVRHRDADPPRSPTATASSPGSS